MGAWGNGPLASDQALDWLGPVADEVAGKIENLLDQFDASEHVDRYATEVRGAAWLCLNARIDFSPRAEDEIHQQLVDALQRILDSDWINEWSEPEEVRESIRGQIALLTREGE